MDTYLITGGAGFIGRQVAAEMLAAGARVRILDALIDQVHGDGEPVLPPGAEFIEGDVRDATLVARAVEGGRGCVPPCGRGRSWAEHV